MRVMQFGGGNFLRGFFDWILQKISDAGAAKYDVTLVSTVPGEDCGGLVRAGRYQVLSRGYSGAEYCEMLDTVRVIKGAVNPFTDLDAFLREGMSPDLGLIVSNTTEAGIFHDAEASQPHNYASFLAALIQARARLGLPKPVVMPLELIDRNAETLRDCVEAYGRRFNYGDEFFSFLAGMRFLRTLPDRIVPGFPKDAAQRINAKNGWDDPFLTSGELFHLLVIKADASFKEILPFDRAGLNILLADEQFSFYRDRKVKILNGCHTASVAYAMESGLENVDAFASDPGHGEWLGRLTHEEIVPTLYSAGNDLAETHQYADDVIQRFKNPALGHSFRSIALNSISKCQTRLEPTLIDFHRMFAKSPPLLEGAVVKLVRMYRRGPVVDFPGGPLELKDHAAIAGLDAPATLAKFLPHAEASMVEAMSHALR